MERAKKVYAKCKMNCNLDYSLVVEDELVKWKLTINVDGIEEEENRL